MTPDSWTQLKQFTAARIARGRSGGSITTAERLDFQLACARAAVHAPFNASDLAADFAGLPLPALVLESCAADRATYLRRPDLGRRLSARSRTMLETMRPAVLWDLVILVSDGLSALAAVRQSRPLLAALLPRLAETGWRIAPLFIIPNARVALQDEVGGLLGATLSLMLLGERPGLGSPDSLGAYFTFRPAPGKTDADRNCISNIRPESLRPEVAAEKLFHLLTESLRRQISGVNLKDNPALPAADRSPGAMATSKPSSKL